MEKKRFKLYKSGKQWISMALVAVASLTLGMTMATVDGQADASIQNDAVTTTQVADQSNSQSATASTSMAIASQTTANTTNTDENQTNNSTEQKNTETPNTTGLVQRNNGTYYYNADSQSYVTNTWENVNNSWYHFGDDGNATTGWYQSGAGLWYYFQDTGVAQTGWYKSQAGLWYYFDPSNAWADEGWQNINNNWYHFDETNAWADTGWYKSNAGNWYHFDETNANATTGWYQSQAGLWYHFDETNAWANTGWYKSNAGNWYYFDPTNAWMLTGTQTIDGKTYNFNADGSWADDYSAAVAKAMSVRGTAYVWGGNNPSTGFDCSGLVQWAYGLGSNYRTTYAQQTLGAHHYDVANAPKGSLLFFGSDSAPYHVAISLGNGAYVHAPQPGDVVKVGYTQYYAASYYVVL